MSVLESDPLKKWTIPKIRSLVQEKFGVRPCWAQIKPALLLREGKDVVQVAATGAGKTLSFWIPLLTALEDGLDKMIFVVTPIKLLGKQNTSKLQSLNISSIAISQENNSAATWRVRWSLIHPSSSCADNQNSGR